MSKKITEKISFSLVILTLALSISCSTKSTQQLPESSVPVAESKADSTTESTIDIVEIAGTP